MWLQHVHILNNQDLCVRYGKFYESYYVNVCLSVFVYSYLLEKEMEQIYEASIFFKQLNGRKQ